MTTAAIRPGSRLRCTTCGSEFVIVKPQQPEVSCCGEPLSEFSAKKPGA